MKIMRRTSCLVLALLMAAAVAGNAVEVDSGGVRLILHEGIGRFSLYTRPEPGSPEYVPLFVDQDPRTSGISLVVNDKIYKLGESAEFSESSEKSTETVGSSPPWKTFSSSRRTWRRVSWGAPGSSRRCTPASVRPPSGWVISWRS